MLASVDNMYGHHDAVSDETHPPNLNRSAVPLPEDDTKHGSFTFSRLPAGMKVFSYKNFLS